MTQESQINISSSTSNSSSLQALSEECRAQLPNLRELLTRRQSWEEEAEKLENHILLIATDQKQLAQSRLYAMNGLKTFAACHLDSALSCLAHQKELFTQVTGFVDADLIEHYQDSVIDDLAYAPMFHPGLTKEGLVTGELLLFLEHLQAAHLLMQKIEVMAMEISNVTASLSK